MTKEDIKQFKLTNDDEILCEVLNWDDDEGSVLIRGALRIINIEDYGRGMRFYAFRPWVLFQDDPSEISIINTSHIIAEASPSKEILKHYGNTLKEIRKQTKAQKSKKDIPLEQVAAKMDEMDEEDFERYMDTLVGASDVDDSDMPSNVIRFKPPKTFH